MATNVGDLAISLDIEVSSRLQDQINKVSNGVADKLKSNIEKSVTKSDLSKTIGKSMSGVIKKASDIGSKIGQSIESKIKASMERSKASIDKTVTKASTIPQSQSMGGSASSSKGLKGVPKEFLVTKRDSSMQMQDNVNAQIEQLAQKMKELRNLSIDGSKSEEMLKIEARMISLTDKSDKLTLDIRQLDAAIDGFDANEINDQGGKAAETIDRIDKAAKKATGSMNGLGGSSAKAQRPLINMRSIGASLARNFLGLQLLITLVGQAVRKMAQAFWNALTTNDQFNSSLNQIKSNLATAFQPIFQAIMPAINAMMAGLAKATAYLAAFISMLFGKSVKAMNASAKAMSKANKETSRMVAGFDQLNDITESSGDSASGSISTVNIDEGNLDLFTSKMKLALDEAMSYLKPFSAQTLMLFENIWKSLKDGVSRALDDMKPLFSWISKIAKDAIKGLTEAIKELNDSFGDTTGLSDFFKMLTTIGAYFVLFKSVSIVITGIIAAFGKAMSVVAIIGKALGIVIGFVTGSVAGMILGVAALALAIIGVITNFKQFKSDVTAILNNIIGAFVGLINFLKGVFTGNWKLVWKGIIDVITNLFSGIVNIIKLPINAIIDGLNAVISSINRVKVPSWIPSIGGKGISLPSIPRLANGGVLKEPTLNIAGEYPGASSNPEIVAPQNILADTFRSVLREFMNEMHGNGQASNQTIDLVVNIGGRKLLSELIKLADEYKKQTGKELTFNV